MVFSSPLFLFLDWPVVLAIHFVRLGLRSGNRLPFRDPGVQTRRPLSPPMQPRLGDPLDRSLCKRRAKARGWFHP